jgi:hypothetical protein
MSVIQSILYINKDFYAEEVVMPVISVKSSYSLDGQIAAYLSIHFYIL